MRLWITVKTIRSNSGGQFLDLTDICKECGSVLDLNVTGLDNINVLAAQDFDGEIEGHVTYFYGKCSSCKAKRQTS